MLVHGFVDPDCAEWHDGLFYPPLLEAARNGDREGIYHDGWGLQEQGRKNGEKQRIGISGPLSFGRAAAMMRLCKGGAYATQTANRETEFCSTP